MNYKTSKDYKRLYHLLYVEKQDVFGSSIMGFEFAQKNPETKVDPYYRRYECFRHNKYGEMNDVFGNPCFEKSLELFCSFCQKNDVDFIDPADYPVCVQKNAENETQNSLCRTDETQRRSVWHTPDEVPQIPAGKTRVRIVFISDDKGFRVLKSDSFRTFEWWHIETLENHMVKWMYFDDLEAL